MRSSPEFRDAKVVIVGASESGRFELLHAIASRLGGDAPETVDAGPWRVLRSDVPAQGLRIHLCCVDGESPYRGVESLLLEDADAAILMVDVSPEGIAASRRCFDRWKPDLEGDRLAHVVQYHRIEREPRFDPAVMDAWLGLRGEGVLRVATHSEAPDGPGGSFDRLVARLNEERAEA